MDEATLARVEEQRLQLEASITTLRKSLRHWQTLEIDYEGLKEEYLGLPESASSQQCLQAAQNFAPELVGEEEIQGLLADKNSGHKKPSQLVDIFEKRSDYVLRNIATIRKQLSDAEKKRNALLLAENPEHQDEAGLPLREITEELDEEGLVISSKVQAPGVEAPNLVEALRKAGVTDLETRGKDSTITNQVTRTETTSVRPDSPEHTEVLGPTNPDDTEEDAALRREMLQYGLDEVGAIVAELDLAEHGSDISYDEDMSDFDEDEVDDESEDERGATKGSVISDQYKRKMESLQKKFGLPEMQNIGPSELEKSEIPTEVIEEATEPVIESDVRPKAKSNIKPKKSVSFAKGLDIAIEPQKNPKEVAGAEPSSQTAPSSGKIVADELVERPTAKTLAPDASNFNEELHQREVAVEYQKLRNRRIHDQGGYVGGGELENWGEELAPVAIEPGKAKVSRFKAARLKGR